MNTHTLTTVATAAANLEETAVSARAKHEIRHEPFHGSFSQETDQLLQLKSNIQELSDLHSRLRFMMREVSYLLKAR